MYELGPQILALFSHSRGIAESHNQFYRRSAFVKSSQSTLVFQVLLWHSSCQPIYLQLPSDLSH